MVEGDIDQVRIGSALAPALLIEAREVGEVDPIDLIVA